MDTERAHLEARIAEIEWRLRRYGCFDLTEEDVHWLLARLREALAESEPLPLRQRGARAAPLDGER